MGVSRYVEAIKEVHSCSSTDVKCENNSQAEDCQTMTFQMHKRTETVRTLAVVSKYIVVNGVCIAIICMFLENIILWLKVRMYCYIY